MLMTTVGALQKAAKDAHRATNRRGSLPILAGLLLEVDDNGTARVTGTNLDDHITAALHVWDTTGPVRVVVPSKPLVDALAKLPDGDARLTVDADELTVAAGESAVSLRRLAESEWPKPPTVGSDLLEVGEATWDAIARILPSASDDRARPILCGVVLGNGWAATTDSYRAAATAVPALPETDQPALVPARAIRDVFAVLAGAVPEIQLGPSTIRFAHDSATITTQLIDGEPPDIVGLIARSRTACDGCFTVDAGELSNALALAGSLAATDSQPITIEVVDGSRLRVSAVAADVGHSSTELTAEIDGAVPRLGFTPRFLNEAIASTNPAGGRFTLNVPADGSTAAVASGADVDVAVMPVQMR